MKRGILFVTFVAATGLVRSADAEQLIVNSYGGPYEDIIRDRIIEPFEKEFGVKVIYDAVGSASQDHHTDQLHVVLHTTAGRRLCFMLGKAEGRHF